MRLVFRTEDEWGPDALVASAGFVVFVINPVTENGNYLGWRVLAYHHGPLQDDLIGSYLTAPSSRLTRPEAEQLCIQHLTNIYRHIKEIL